MNQTVPLGAPGAHPTLASLGEVCSKVGAREHGDRIAELQRFLAQDLASVEEDLQALEPKETPVHLSAKHLLSGGGKRLRPLCVALASRLGTGFDRFARDFAVAVELVHSATLLHDDVVDLGDRRRGAVAARLVYGNAASIFAGDYLLVEALLRVEKAQKPDVLLKALGVLQEMLAAEAEQLALRGRVTATQADYFRIIRGKTASLFRFAMYAGARAGGVDEPHTLALERFGDKLGVAFQVIDDVLDVSGKGDKLGKDPLADLREGKPTLPLLIAFEREPKLRGEFEAAVQTSAELQDERLLARAVSVIRDTGAEEDARAVAVRLTEEAKAELAVLPDRAARDVLVAIAGSLTTRSA